LSMFCVLNIKARAVIEKIGFRIVVWSYENNNIVNYW